MRFRPEGEREFTGDAFFIAGSRGSDSGGTISMSCALTVKSIETSPRFTLRSKYLLLCAHQKAELTCALLPAIPGRDAVGVVDEVGRGVTDTQLDTVFGLGGVSDTTAEFAVLTAWSTVPETLDLVDRAGRRSRARVRYRSGRP